MARCICPICMTGNRIDQIFYHLFKLWLWHSVIIRLYTQSPRSKLLLHIQQTVRTSAFLYNLLCLISFLWFSNQAFMPQPGGQGAANSFLPYPSSSGTGGSNFPPYPTAAGSFYPPSSGPAGGSAGYPPYMNYPQPGGYSGSAGYVSYTTIILRNRNLKFFLLCNLESCGILKFQFKFRHHYGGTHQSITYKRCGGQVKAPHTGKRQSISGWNRNIESYQTRTGGGQCQDWCHRYSPGTRTSRSAKEHQHTAGQGGGIEEKSGDSRERWGHRSRRSCHHHSSFI